MTLSATKFVYFICVLTFFSVQIQARESQFFSKIPSSNSGNNYVQVTPDNNNKEELSLSKQQQQEAKPSGFVPETQKQQEPSFIPETQNGYGLYGQQNHNQFPTSVSAADVKYEPYTTPVTSSTPTGTFESYTTNPATNSASVKYEPYTTPITSTATGTLEPYSTTLTTGYYNNNGYETEQESMGSSKFRESGYTSSNNVEKQQQGMSDTRYLENGKYYYDVNNNKNNYYYPNEYQQQQLLQHRNSEDPQHKPYVWENTPPIHGHDNEENNELP